FSLTSVFCIVGSLVFPYTTLFRSARSLSLLQASDEDRRPVVPGRAHLDDHVVGVLLRDGEAGGCGLRLALDELPVEEGVGALPRSEEHTSELQSREKLVCRHLLEK